jgi:enamine deaminase RidA (YjgF/YER057c/UK114 family)
MTQRHSSGGPWEGRIGYSRSVSADGHLWVSGCTSVVDGVVAHPGDATAQARVAFANALAAVEQAGFTAADVVRTRMYVVDIAANGAAVGAVHGAALAEIRPATTMVGVSALLDAAMLVEVEVDAYRTTT